MFAQITMTTFDYVAFFAMAVVFFGVIYFIIWLGDLPAKIAAQRNHPQVASVQALAWLGLLFTGGVVYILAFAWAYYNYPQTVVASSESESGAPNPDQINEVGNTSNVAKSATGDLS